MLTCFRLCSNRAARQSQDNPSPLLVPFVPVEQGISVDYRDPCKPTLLADGGGVKFSSTFPTTPYKLFAVAFFCEVLLG